MRDFQITRSDLIWVLNEPQENSKTNCCNIKIKKSQSLSIFLKFKIKKESFCSAGDRNRYIQIKS
jgi:hypothetical protein